MDVLRKDRDITKWNRITEYVDAADGWDFTLPHPVHNDRQRCRYDIVVGLNEHSGLNCRLTVKVNHKQPNKIRVTTASGFPAGGQMTINYLAADATSSSGV